jgi:hypothetical protein
MLNLCVFLRAKVTRVPWIMGAFSALFCASGLFALSLDLYHGNVYYARDDRVDTVTSASARRNNFYEDLGLTLQNPGIAGLSFNADVSMMTDKLSGLKKRYEIRSTTLDYTNEAVGLNIGLGRQFINSFARNTGYVDGLSIGYDAGSLLSLSAFVGTANPSRYSDTILSLDPKATEAGLYGMFRIVRGMEIGVGFAADKQLGDTRQYRVAASASSDLGHIVDVQGHARFDISRKVIDEYHLLARLIALDWMQVGLHAAGQARQIDSVNYYERMFLDRYNEAGLLIGFYPVKDVTMLGTYSLRVFGKGTDHLADCNIVVKGASLRLGMNTGVHGTLYEVIPGYTFTYAQVFDIGAAFQFDRFNTELQPDWRNAYTTIAFMRWFVPWFTPGVSLVLEPQVEYLINDYYKKDVRVMFLSRFNFHGFWQEKQNPAPSRVK